MSINFKENVIESGLSNLFVLRSPLQIINAVEAINYFKLKNNILVLIYNRLDSNTKQMKSLLETVKFDKVIHVEEAFRSKYFKYVKLIKDLKQQEYNYIFVGELGISYKTIIANTEKKKVFLLDDGTATIEYYNKFIRHDKYNKYNFREIRFLFSGLKFKVKDKINLFTYFDLEPVHGIDVIRNDLSYLKSNYMKEAKRDDNVIYFIGQPVDGFMDIGFYRDSIEELIKRFNKRIIYVPHRSEGQEQQDTLSLIYSDLFTIKKPDMPLELYFLENNIYPTHIISYLSTALITLSIIYENCKVDFIKIPKSSINKKRIERIENCYILFNKAGLSQLRI